MYHMMCMNDKCKYYWEHSCTKAMCDEKIVIDENGGCETFEEGTSEWYKYCSWANAEKEFLTEYECKWVGVNNDKKLV